MLFHDLKSYGEKGYATVLLYYICNTDTTKVISLILNNYNLGGKKQKISQS